MPEDRSPSATRGLSPEEACKPAGLLLAFGFRAQGSGFRVQGFGFSVSVLGFRVSGSAFQFQASGFRVQRFGFRVQGFLCLGVWGGIDK